MAGDITTWDELLASGLAATEGTLELFIPYDLLEQAGTGWRTAERVVFYGGPSILRQNIPPIRNTGPYKVCVDETVVTLAHAARSSLVLVKPAIIYGLADPTTVANPQGRTRQYACVRLADMPRLRLSRAQASAPPQEDKQPAA